MRRVGLIEFMQALWGANIGPGSGIKASAYLPAIHCRS